MEGAPQSSRPNEGDGRALAEQLHVVPWHDEVTEAHGFGPRSMYVEVCWLPVMGPTATWLYRRLGSWVEYNPAGLTVNLQQVSESIGLGEALGRHSKIAKALGRLARYQAVRWGGDELQVRTALPPLPLRLVKGLDPQTRRLHERYTAAPRRDQNGLVT